MSEIAQKKLKIGVSGKRDIFSNICVQEEIKKSIAIILKKEKTKSFIAYSAMAKGADTIFANVVTKQFNQEIKIILPFDTAEYEKDFTDSTELNEYKNWISTVGISKVVTKDIPKTRDLRNEAYLSVGKFIVESCDYLIIIWDEQKPRGKGGTAEILGYASQCSTLKGLEIIRIQPTQNDKINNKLKSLLNVSDKNAIRFKKKYEAIWILSLILGWLTAICFSTTLSFHLNIPTKILFTFLKLTFIFIVFILIRIIRIYQFHPNLLKERLNAEKLRLLSVYYHADLPITISEITQKTDEKLADIGEQVNAVRNSTYQSRWYKYFVIKTLIDVQIKYHHNLSENVIGSIPKKLNLLNSAIHIAWILLLISHLFSLLLEYFNIYIPILSDYSYPVKIVTFFIICLPATYAGIEGYLYFKEWEDFKKQSYDMLKLLRQERNELEKCKPNDVDILRILNRVCFSMLDDNKNWISIISKKETPHPIL